MVKPALASGLISLAVLGGCRVEGNDTLAIGDSLRLPASGGAHANAALPLDRTMTARPEPVTLDRSEWQTIQFEVPVDGPNHNRTYATAVWDVHAPREAGNYPTPLTTLDTSGRTRADQVSDQWVTSKHLVKDLIFAPFLAIDAAVEGGRPSGGFASYQRARTRPWLGEILGVTAMPVAPTDVHGRPAPSRPGVIRRYSPPPEGSK